jgi:hypothetical protein
MLAGVLVWCAQAQWLHYPTPGTPRTRDGKAKSTRMTERFRSRDFGHMEGQITIDDPQNHTRQFTIQFNWRLIPDTDILEAVSAENERDIGHIGVQ